MVNIMEILNNMPIWQAVVIGISAGAQRKNRTSTKSPTQPLLLKRRHSYCWMTYRDANKDASKESIKDANKEKTE